MMTKMWKLSEIMIFLGNLVLSLLISRFMLYYGGIILGFHNIYSYLPLSWFILILSWYILQVPFQCNNNFNFCLVRLCDSFKNIFVNLLLIIFFVTKKKPNLKNYLLNMSLSLFIRCLNFIALTLWQLL